MKILVSLIIFWSVAAITVSVAEAANLQINPATGVYTNGTNFTVRLTVNTAGKSINAAEGILNFNPNELSVVSVDKSGSIFNLWVAEPAFSNTNGTLSFSGGVPSGYMGNSGTILTVIFRAKTSGAAKINFSSGAVLANDGQGTNVLAGMNGGTFTLQALSEQPKAEVIEYIAPANTPAAPIIESTTHPDQKLWSKNNKAILSWVVPDDVTAVRTLLDANPTSVPTKVYEERLNTITLEDLPDGESYLHVQFKNAEGWGRVAHHRLAIDTNKPEEFLINLEEEADLSSPTQVLLLQVTDKTSPVERFLIKHNEAEPWEFLDVEKTGKIKIENLKPGYHAFIIEAFDKAGNSIVSSFSFSVDAFSEPIFTEFPNEINEEVIPVIKGMTRPNSTLDITFGKVGAEPSIYKVTADTSGEFIFIPSSTLSLGVYEIQAVATDQYGAQSSKSAKITIAVQQPGYVRIGSLLVSALSVFVPLLALSVLLVLFVSGLWLYLRRFRRRVSTESHEALTILRSEFAKLEAKIDHSITTITEGRRSKKMTESEILVFQELRKSVKEAEEKISKEVTDVETLV